MTAPALEKQKALAAEIVERTRAKGAEVAEVLVSEGSELSAKVRLLQPELVQEASSASVGLRVIIDHRQACTYTSDTTAAGLAALISDAVELAGLAERDPLCGPPDEDLLAKEFPELELSDPEVQTIDAESALMRAKEAEHAAKSFDPRISNSEGAVFSRESGATVFASSAGFIGAHRGSYASLSVSPVAQDQNGKMQTGSYWDAKRHLHDLEAADRIGREAARRTLAKLGAKPVETCEVPVIFDPEAGRGLLSLLFSCIAGTAIYRRTSYLLDREGSQIADPRVTITDDPLLPRGPGSRPFDGEGLPSRRNVVVDKGVLKTFLCDTYSGRKLGRPSTGSASRGLGGPPSVAPTNFYLAAGERDPEAIIREVDRGLLVTDLMGFGFNAVTGDFSQGAEGFWIEKGERVFPVGGVTVSLGFGELWRRVDAIGKDLELKTRYAAPTFRVSRMTVAGT